MAGATSSAIVIRACKKGRITCTAVISACSTIFRFCCGSFQSYVTTFSSRISTRFTQFIFFIISPWLSYQGAGAFLFLF